MIGLVTSDELVEIETRKSTPQQVPLSPNAKSTLTIGQYSRQSGRWNETPKSAGRSRSLGRSSAKSVVSNHVFCVDEQEREVWVRIKIISLVLFLQYSFSRCFKYFVKYYKRKI
jgi:hypothetical protein